MNLNKVLDILGLAAKAGQCFSGDNVCEKIIRSGNAKIVIISEDASENTKKKFLNMCSHKSVPLIQIGNSWILGNAIGKTNRKIVTIINDAFYNMLLSEIDENSMINHGGGI